MFPHIDEPNKRSPVSWIPLNEIDIEKIKKGKNDNHE